MPVKGKLDGEPVCINPHGEVYNPKRSSPSVRLDNTLKPKKRGSLGDPYKGK